VGPLVSARRGRYSTLLGLAVVVLVVVNIVFAKSADVTGIAPDRMLAPFATPLVLGSLDGDADIATRADEGADGRVPACAERGAQILNVCQLYERGPVVLALFVDGGSCARVLTEMQALVPAFPQVRFAAVSIEGDRRTLRRLVRSLGLTLPVGIDSDGAVAALYKVVTCPQLNFAYRGGVVQSRALLGGVSLATLRRRVSELAAASRVHERPEPAA
jgi:AhpC/TSA family